MGLDQLLTNVTVVGTTGNVGKVISSLIAQEVIKLKLNSPDKLYKINLIDDNEQEFGNTRKYIKDQMLKIAEKSISNLRKYYESREDLIENSEIINEFISSSLSALRFDNELDIARSTNMVFIAIKDNEQNRNKVLSAVNDVCTSKPISIVNTSSISDESSLKEAELQLPVLGYTFSDPPDKKQPVVFSFQKDADQELKGIVIELGNRFGRKFV